MKLTINELHFIIKNLQARTEWIEDNPNDLSEDEGEKYAINSILSKLKEIQFDLELATEERK